MAPDLMHCQPEPSDTLNLKLASRRVHKVMTRATEGQNLVRSAPTPERELWMI